eukprot:bmy_07543T0
MPRSSKTCQGSTASRTEPTVSRRQKARPCQLQSHIPIFATLHLCLRCFCPLCHFCPLVPSSHRLQGSSSPPPSSLPGLYHYLHRTPVLPATGPEEAPDSGCVSSPREEPTVEDRTQKSPFPFPS